MRRRGAVREDGSMSDAERATRELLVELLGVFYGALFGLIFAAVGASQSEIEPAYDLDTIAGYGAIGLGLVAIGLLLTAYLRKSMVNASFGGLEIGPHRVEAALETGPLFRLYLANVVLIVATFGFYSPWAKVRQMQYQLAHLRVVARGDLDQFVAAAGDDTDAIGEEVGDFFDIDFGL